MKIFKTAIQIMLLVALLIGVTSCDKDFLNVENPNQLTPDTFWKNETDVIKGLGAAYNHMQYQVWDGRWGFFEMFYENYQCRSDLIALYDMWAPFGGMSRYEAYASAYVLNDYWKHTYEGLYAVNQVIENTPNIEGDDATKAALIGEAKFIRAYFHFYLLMNFGNIVMVTETPGSPDDFYRSQSAPEAVWDQIVADLQEAKSVLPAQWADQWLGRATKGAAATMLGKAYLYQRDWARAASEFQEVTAMGYTLEGDYESLFTGNNEWNGESIFEINFTMNDAGGRNERTAFPAMMGPWKMDHPNAFLKGLYMEDLTPAGDFSTRVYGSIVFNDPSSTIWYLGDGTFADYYGADDNNAYWKKYGSHPGSDANNGYSWSHSGMNFVVMRYADVLLMLAEALNEQGSTAEAAGFVNQVRARAGVENIDTAMSQNDLREHIRHVERPLELAGECVRWFDLVRWYGDGDLKSVLRDHGREAWENFDNGIDIYYPIPFNEISSNPNVAQNPGY